MCKDEVRLGTTSTSTSTIDKINYFNPAPFLFKREKIFSLCQKGKKKSLKN